MVIMCIQYCKAIWFGDKSLDRPTLVVETGVDKIPPKCIADNREARQTCHQHGRRYSGNNDSRHLIGNKLTQHRSQLR